MLELMTYKPAFGEPSGSPFCVKAMCLLEMSGLDWRPQYTSDPRKAPMAKFPVLKEDGLMIADSNIIQKHLSKKHKVRFDPDLSPQEIATGHALKRMTEEHLYFTTVNDRWGNDENWKHVVPAYFSEIPSVLRSFVTNGLRKQAIKGLSWMGISRYSKEVQLDRTSEDLQAITNQLENKAFLFGDNATTFDAAIVPQLFALAASPSKTPLSKLVSQNPALTAYMKRFRDDFYPKFQTQ